MDKAWFNKNINEIVQELGTNIEKGLTNEQVQIATEKFGENELQGKKKKTLLQKFLQQFKDFMIIILIIAAVVSGIIGITQGEGITDTIVILIVIIINAIIGVVQENKAEKSLEALKKLSGYTAKVMRNGQLVIIPARELVPGDVVILDTGDFVPADLRVIEAINLKSQESALTGESVPVEKQSNVIDDEAGIGDRNNMLFSSSLITYGRGKAIVVETGMKTEVGKIANILNETETSNTPLQKRLNGLGKTLGIVVLVLCAIIFIVGFLYNKEVVNMFMTAVSLAVAAIPEGLPAVATIVLAIGVQKMAKRHAIIKTLPSVETLGCATVICSDKTGTLTQNKMTVTELEVGSWKLEVGSWRPDDGVNDNAHTDLIQLIHCAMLCNDSKISNDNTIMGDPTETALIDLGFKLGYSNEVLKNTSRVGEIPFDSDRKLMTVVVKSEPLSNPKTNVGVGVLDDPEPTKYLVYTKGGLEELLNKCSSYVINGEIKKNLDEYMPKIRVENENMAKNALRVLAFAYKELDHMPSKEEIQNIEKDLIFIGMTGMIDPAREEAKEAVNKCKTAGIKVVMITGDHAITASTIARDLGILENENEVITGAHLEKMSDEELIKNVKKYSVYARVSPEHKVRIVKAWQANGEVVAMTGDRSK